MKCLNCHHENSEGNVFCEKCGSTLMKPKCSKCGAEHQQGALFCPMCGQNHGHDKNRTAGASAARKPSKPALLFGSLGVLVVGVVVGLVFLLGGQSIEKIRASMPKIVTGYPHCVALNTDGTVSLYAAGSEDEFARSKVTEWTDMIDVAVNHYGETAGVKKDGTVIVDLPYYDDRKSTVQDSVAAWENIIKIFMYDDDTIVGLKKEGKVVTNAAYLQKVGFHDSCPEYLQSASKWSDIVDIVASESYGFIAGLKSDGTVVIASDGTPLGAVYTDQKIKNIYLQYGLYQNDTIIGINENNEFVISYLDGSFYNISEVNKEMSEGIKYVFTRTTASTLKKDGKLISLDFPSNTHQTEPDRIEIDNVIDIVSTGSYTIALKRDGTVSIVDFSDYEVNPEILEWTDIVAVSCYSHDEVVGYKSDGTFVSAPEFADLSAVSVETAPAETSEFVAAPAEVPDELIAPAVVQRGISNNNSANGGNMTEDEKYIYLHHSIGDEVEAYSLISVYDKSTGQPLSANIDSIENINVYDGYLYGVTNYYSSDSIAVSGSIVRGALQDGIMQSWETLLTPQGSITEMIAYDGRLYWIETINYDRYLLYQSDLSGQNVVIIAESSGALFSLNIENAVIYYAEHNRESYDDNTYKSIVKKTVYSIKTDGMDQQVLFSIYDDGQFEEDFYYYDRIIVNGSQLWYLHFSEKYQEIYGSMLFSYNLQTGESTPVVSGVDHFALYQDKIYYCRGGNLCFCNIDGSNEKIICQEVYAGSSDISLTDGKIFVNGSYAQYGLNSDGTVFDMIEIS